MPLVRPNLPPRPGSTGNQQRGQPPKWAACPRSTFSAGRDDDWYQVTSPRHFPDFDICSTCFDTSIRNTPYAHCMTEAARKPRNTSTKCDFSDLWIRAAYAMLFIQNKPDLSLLGRVASQPSDEDGPCPNLNDQNPVVQKKCKPTAVRTWYCAYDSATGSYIDDLTVCSACVFRVNTIFPSLTGLFRPVSGGAKVQATCDLLTSPNLLEGQRGGWYLNKLIEAERDAVAGRADLHSIIAFYKRWASIPVCLKDDPVPAGVPYYKFATFMPMFAACQHCYTAYFLPLLESTNAPSFMRDLQLDNNSGGFVCDMYSPRQLSWFEEACATNDIQAWKQKILAREAKFQETNLRLQQLKAQYQACNGQAYMHHSQGQTAEIDGMLQAGRWDAGAWYNAPALRSAINHDRAKTARNQGEQAMLQAQMISRDYDLVQKEWTDMYE